MDQAEEIKSKLDIVEVIREYIPVKAVGANFQALCPFHNEKTPSFIISPDKQIWHCFGCDRGGDIFSFVMEKEGLNFVEALRLLAPKAGVVLKFENSKNYSERNRILDILELAGKYYAHILTIPAGKKAKDYLLKRGLSSETIKDWQLGYSLDSWNSFYNLAKSRPKTGKKYTTEEIYLAGLILSKNKNSQAGFSQQAENYYDRFRGRIMFPIWDVNDNIIAFTARVSPDREKIEKSGKYINSPQGKVYDKSRVLFALNKAKTAIRKNNLAIVVEGQMDAISCHQHGFNNVVASSGTALGAEQVSLLKRFTTNIALLFDMDTAGQLAVDRGIKEVLAQGLNLKIIVLPGYKDPDECLQDNPKVFAQAVADAQPMLEYYFSKVKDGLDLENLDNKRLVRDKMFAMISLVVNKTEQGYWLKNISEGLDFFENDTREEFLKWQRKNSQGLKKISENSSEDSVLKTTREEKLIELLLAILIKFPEFINYSVNNLEPEDLTIEDLSRFYRDFIIYYNKVTTFDYQNFKVYLQELGDGNRNMNKNVNYENNSNGSKSENVNGDNDRKKAGLLNKLILLGEKNFYDQESAQVKTELISIIADLKKYSKQKRIKRLQEKISQAEAEERTGDLDGLMNDLKNLTSF